MVVKAVFKGEDSLGYVKGSPYDLDISNDGKKVVVRRRDGNGTCVYDSIFAFFHNWSNVTSV